MTLTREDINIEKLVESIHAAEDAYRNGTWREYAKENGFSPWNYAGHVTGLYTLRAWLRGRLHRHNPPEEIRDFNRTVQEQGLPYKLREWDATDHNRKIAEQVAERFRREPEPAAATG